MKTCKIALLIISLFFGFVSCKKGSLKEQAIDLLFPESDDIKLGAQVEADILSKPSEYPLIPTSNTVAYEVIEKIKNNILNSGNVYHRDDFAWKVRIIHDDNTLNAFCTPGGYIFVYTGIIKYLDTEDQLAGVLGHEIAHADRRHYINQQIKNGATQILISAVGGDKNAIGQMVAGVIALKYSRDDETDADNQSVSYLSGTNSPQYACNSAGVFFQKLLDGGNDCNAITGFFSTHPCPANRVTNINTKATENGCSTTPSGSADYAKLIASLPTN